jgi:hypothetical protein
LTSIDESLDRASKDWPAYATGPRDSIFAMGVVSIKFAELESVLIFIFATVKGISLDEATKTASKVGTRNCQRLTAQGLAANQWPARTNELVDHFVEGVSVCIENRNNLMHSNLAWTGGEHTVLYKTSKDNGRTVMAVPKPSELRRVADDINAFILFGRQLGNAINNASSEVPIFPEFAFPWPNDPPPMPSALVFTEEPQPLRKDGK